ncbi:MAG: response regulator [Mariprofundaceae bacterium]
MPDKQLATSLLALFDYGRDAMFIADLDGRFTHVNEAFLNLYNYTKSDVIGQPISMIKSHLHDKSYYQSIQNELKTQGIWSGELCNSSYAGEIIHIWTQIISTENGYLGIQVDLRERDRTARQVEQTARLESISTLAGGIAHEFNNILAGLQGHMHMIRRIIPEDNIKEKERMQRIGKLFERASGLVHNMLVFSKQKQTINRDMPLSALLEDTIKLVTPSIPKMIRLKFETNHHRLIILANEIQMKQTLFELITNASGAFDRMDESTLPFNPEILVKLDLKDQHTAEITVKDNGYGMQPNELKHCKDPFFTTKPVGQGTGLGLSSANSYIKQLGGSLEISSQPRKGTTVQIMLPLAHKTDHVQPLNRTILLVDDDQDIRMSLHEIMASHGYKVLDADDGIQALDMWQQHKESIDAIIMDIVMPNMDGLEVAGKIRETGSKVPICMMTGYSNQSIPADIHVQLLRKPVDPDLILKYLDHQLSEKASET